MGSISWPADEPLASQKGLWYMGKFWIFTKWRFTAVRCVNISNTKYAPFCLRVPQWTYLVRQDAVWTHNQLGRTAVQQLRRLQLSRQVTDVSHVTNRLLSPSQVPQICRQTSAPFCNLHPHTSLTADWMWPIAPCRCVFVEVSELIAPRSISYEPQWNFLEHPISRVLCSANDTCYGLHSDLLFWYPDAAPSTDNSCTLIAPLTVISSTSIDAGSDAFRLDTMTCVSKPASSFCSTANIAPLEANSLSYSNTRI
jgi:hypothetical protein